MYSLQASDHVVEVADGVVSEMLMFNHEFCMQVYNYPDRNFVYCGFKDFPAKSVVLMSQLATMNLDEELYEKLASITDYELEDIILLTDICCLYFLGVCAKLTKHHRYKSQSSSGAIKLLN